MTKERNLVMIALFAALVAVLGFLPSYMLPWGVPVTAQSLGVMLAGTVLGARRGGLALLLFTLLVALGLPLLAGGRGGLGVFTSPTAGFIIGFPFAAFATGFVMSRMQGNTLISAMIAALVGGIVVLYGFGIIGFYLMTDRTLAGAIGVMAVYIPGDLLKVVITGFVTQAIWRARPQMLLTR